MADLRARDAALPLDPMALVQPSKAEAGK